MAKWNEQELALKVEHMVDGRGTVSKNADSIRAGEFSQVLISHIKNECVNNETVSQFVEKCKQHLGESLSVIGEETANSLFSECKGLKKLYPRQFNAS